MNSVSRAVVLFIAQGAYSGKSPFAPGTAGTAVAILLFLGVRNLSPVSYGTLCVVLCIIGTWTADEAELILGRKDHPSIVIDEIAGYLISLFLVPPTWGFVIAGFFLFRFFDIVKPWPLYGLQQIRGGLGVMLDDIGAGIYTNIALQIVAYFKIF
ncbi:MAG TPA: phosphatidylglycerophosphatase A [Nitrospirota bacterium]|nr:phosphatidylglycerophosphatase A [Nitrospirota bacterium]